MTDPMDNSTDDLLKKLLASVSTLQNDVNHLKERHYPKKRPRDGDGSSSNDPETTGRDGDRVEGYRDSDNEEDPPEDGEINTESDGSNFKLSEEGEAFLETACGSRLDYKTRKPKMAKYGIPDTKWITCPSLPPVVEATLPKDAVSKDKTAFRTQEMYMEAMAPLVSLLEQAGASEEFTLKEAIPMIQSALVLLGDAVQNQSSLRRKELMKHLNPQLQSLMKDSDFKGAQPFLFGEDFGEKAKAKLEAAAALKKSIAPPPSKPKQPGFRPSHPRKSNWGHQGGRPHNYGPGKSKKPQASSSKDK